VLVDKSRNAQAGLAMAKSDAVRYWNVVAVRRCDAGTEKAANAMSPRSFWHAKSPGIRPACARSPTGSTCLRASPQRGDGDLMPPFRSARVLLCRLTRGGGDGGVTARRGVAGLPAPRCSVKSRAVRAQVVRCRRGGQASFMTETKMAGGAQARPD
jgi:hypothetical protein